MLTNGASESSIPLEIASRLAGSDVNVIPVSLFPPDDSAFGLDVRSLDARSLLDPAAYWRWFRLVRRIRPDVVHVQGHISGGPARILATLAGVPAIVSTEHNPHPHWPLHRRTVNEATNWLSDVVVCNSHSTRASLGALARTLFELAGTELTVIQHGVDVDGIAAGIAERTPPPLPENELVVGFAGRLVEQKNPQLLLHALQRLRGDDLDVGLAIVGAGTLTEQLETLAKELGIADAVRFYGFLPERADVWAFMDAVDVMTYPSEYEGFGVAAAESMATGTPVVLSDIPVYREVAGDAAEFVDRTPESVAAGIRELVDPGVREALGERGQERIRENFRVEGTVAAHERLYRRLAGDEAGTLT
jgi:glycosyltransferase involved in cell wall biosynthesis